MSQEQNNTQQQEKEIISASVDAFMLQAGIPQETNISNEKKKVIDSMNKVISEMN